MQWRDFFYFSKGERQALTLLLALIVISFIFRVFYYSDGQIIHSATIVGQVNPSEIIYPDKHKTEITVLADSVIIPEKALQKNWRTASGSKKYTEKYPVGTFVDLNKADTMILKKVPGIGSAFANRIIKYRNLLGGFTSVEQLGEVYGIDEDRYEKLKVWFKIDLSDIDKIPVNSTGEEILRKHPYINYRQARIIAKYRTQKGRIEGWENLVLLEEFTDDDISRLKAYIEFD